MLNFGNDKFENLIRQGRETVRQKRIELKNKLSVIEKELEELEKVSRELDKEEAELYREQYMSLRNKCFVDDDHLIYIKILAVIEHNGYYYEFCIHRFELLVGDHDEIVDDLDFLDDFTEITEEEYESGIG